MTNKYRLAVIGAGEGGLSILKKAQSMPEVATIAFGQADSMGRGLADEFVATDINDIEYVITKCKDFGVNGVIGTSESTTEVTAVIADRLGLPGNDISQGFGARNKYVMRQRVSELKTIRQPRFELYVEGKKYEYPIVVKSLDSCGKRGVSVAHNDEELRDAVSYSQEYSTGGKVLIEEFLAGGKEYSIECLAGCGLYEVIQITEKDSAGPPHFTENGHHQPAKLGVEMKERINVAAIDVLKTLGIRCGMAHMEIKIIDNNLYFIEVGARGGGDHISDILTVNSTDFDYFKAAIECCLGIYEHKEVHQVAYTGIYFHCKDNEYLKPIFDKAKTADWCIVNTVTSDLFDVANSNVETAKSGYIIYKSDRKITLDSI